MEPMIRIFPTLTAMVAVLACGVVHGIWTDRWHITDEPGMSAAKLARVPLTVGDWEGQKADGKQGKDMAGSLFHLYTNRLTGKKVTLFIVCDRPGKVSIHTPDVCYGAVGFEVMTPIKYSLRLPEGAEPATLWTARFRKTTATETSELRIFWGWNAGEGWQAQDEPRTAFARFPALYKLYLIREKSSGEESLEEDPCVDLMKQLLPELRRALFSPS
jgi:hypothetical protein